MKIEILPYQDTWASDFQLLKTELQTFLSAFNPIIEHFGSTAVPGLAAKPVIDILVGIPTASLFSDIEGILQQEKDYIHYSCFDELIPLRRLFVRLKDSAPHHIFPNSYDNFENIPHDEINTHRKAHIHIWDLQSQDWFRHIAFRDYLIAHKTVRDEYQELKISLEGEDWKDGMHYNDAKNEFIKREEQNALEWKRSINLGFRI